MKKTVILFIALFTLCGVYAQTYRPKVAKPEYNNSIGLSFPHLADATLHLTYETAVTGRFSVGGHIEYRLGKSFFNYDAAAMSFEVDPMLKYYMSGQANSHGFYIQLDLLLGYYKDREEYQGAYAYDPNNIRYGNVVKEFAIFGYGVGPRLGYLFKFPNPHWGIDLSAGWEFVKYTDGMKWVEDFHTLLGEMWLYNTIGAIKIVYRF
jgi:hypothetical protein